MSRTGGWAPADVQVQGIYACMHREWAPVHANSPLNPARQGRRMRQARAGTHAPHPPPRALTRICSPCVVCGGVHCFGHPLGCSAVVQCAELCCLQIPGQHGEGGGNAHTACACATSRLAPPTCALHTTALLYTSCPRVLHLVPQHTLTTFQILSNLVINNSSSCREQVGGACALPLSAPSGCASWVGSLTRVAQNPTPRCPCGHWPCSAWALGGRLAASNRQTRAAGQPAPHPTHPTPHSLTRTHKRTLCIRVGGIH